MLLEKVRRAAPGQFGGLAVMHGHSLFVDEGVLGIIAEDLERFSGRLHALLERVDRWRSLFAYAALVSSGTSPAELPPIECK